MTVRKIFSSTLISLLVAASFFAFPAKALTSPVFKFKWGTTGNGDGQFTNPYGIAVDSSGNIYVTELGNNRIQKFNSSGVFQAKWGTAGSGDGQLSSPRGIAVDLLGNIYVTELGNNRIQKFNSSGVFQAKWGTAGSGDGQFNNPMDVTVDSLGNVYVTDLNNNRIQKFNSSGAFQAKWGTSGSGDGQFSGPDGIDVDSSGNIYVVDSYRNRVQKFDASGVFQSKWGITGSGDGQFSTPRGITVDSSGSIYVTDTGNNRVQKFNAAGTFQSKWGSYGASDGQFNFIEHIAINSFGTAYVVDYYNNRVQVFDTTPFTSFSPNLMSLDRLKASTATGGTVCVKPATTGTEGDVKVTFPTGFTVNSTAANWTVSTASIPAGSTAWPGIGTATSVIGQNVFFPSSDLTVGTNYCFTFSGTNTLTTGSAGNSQQGSITTEALTSNAPIDYGTYAVSLINDDQIVLSATVPPIFTFTLSGNTDTFTSALSPTAVTSTSGKTATIATNADSGWVAWIKSANAGLVSSSASTTIATIGTLNNTPESLTNGTNGYGLDVDITTDSATGDGTVSQASNYGAEYNATTTSVGTLSTTFQPVAAANGTTNGDVLTFIERATISSVTPAASDYTDTLTIITAGRF